MHQNQIIINRESGKWINDFYKSMTNKRVRTLAFYHNWEIVEWELNFNSQSIKEICEWILLCNSRRRVSAGFISSREVKCHLSFIIEFGKTNLTET